MGELLLPNFAGDQIFNRKTMADICRISLLGEGADRDWRRAIAAIRWEDGFARCPNCGSAQCRFRAPLQRWECKKCPSRFSVKVGTLFQRSPISVSCWLAALFLLLAGDSTVGNLTRALDLPRSTVGRMLRRFQNPCIAVKPRARMKAAKYRTKAVRNAKAAWAKGLERLNKTIARYSSEEFASRYVETLRGLLAGVPLKLPAERSPISEMPVEKKTRNRRSVYAKLKIVEAASNFSVSVVAKVYGVTPNQIYAWRRISKLQKQSGTLPTRAHPGFMPVTVWELKRAVILETRRRNHAMRV